MARLGSLVNQTLVGGEGYYDYELEVGRTIVVPWLERRLTLGGAHVGDFGCHAGGVLEALREAGAASGEGFDLDARAVAESPFPKDGRFTIEVRDLLDLADRAYDLIILRDVLEHVPARSELLDVVAGSLRPGGSVFVSFPPYYSPFGGHQQVSANWARLAPYLHLLPSRTFFGLLDFSDNEYLAADELERDLRSVRSTRLTISAAERAFAAAGLRADDRELFLLRPEYAVRYGIRARHAGAIGRVPGIREALVMGAFYLLRSTGNDRLPLR